MKFIKILCAIAATASLVNVATASTAYYGTPKKSATLTAMNSTAGQLAGFVTLYNHTHQAYIVNATFYRSGKPMNNLILNPEGSIDPASGYPSDMITYQIDYPDSSVCLSAIRASDHITVLSNACRGPDEVSRDKRIDIGPNLAATNMPSVTFSK